MEDRIGDALTKWPVIAGLKRAHPDITIVWMAGRHRSVFKRELAALAAGVLDEVHDVCGLGTRWNELLRKPLARHFDIVIATESKLRSTLVLRRVPNRLFISSTYNFLFSDRKRPPNASEPKSVFSRFAQLVSLALGEKIVPLREIPLPHDLTLLAADRLPGKAPYIGFVPGAGGKDKQWPLNNYLQLARLQTERGRCPVFFLGPEEVQWRAHVRSTIPSALFPEWGAEGQQIGNPLLTIALAKRLNGAVANDSGGGHLIAAGGNPLITLFGPTSAEKFEPPYGKHRAISARDFGVTAMEFIPVANVDAELENMLRS
ncbi:MAG: glycosyltransferase family 9 protein [Gammaproteobacteria bacterium]|nr:glycosyltransferase family 9 protein [Gammaproteobacteria bacterium]